MTTWMLLTLALSAGQAPLPDDPGEAFRSGKVKYDVGEFDEALQLFRHAYELKPAPLLLFNMGQCHRQLGDHERAIFFFDGFLREAPKEADKSLVEELIAEETRLLQEQRDKLEAPPDPPIEKRVEPVVKVEVVDKEDPVEVAPEDENSVVLWGAVGAATAVVVGAAVVTAVVLAGAQPPASLGTLEF